MTHRKLLEPMVAYRIGDPRGEWPVFSGAGSSQYPGRWNDMGQAVLYLSQHLATAMLEKIIRLNTLPPNQHYVEVSIPSGCSYEVVNPETLPGWNEESGQTARQHGSGWFEQKRSLVLFVPSAVTRVQQNILLNPFHPEFERVRPGKEIPVFWDKRLFSD
jgi:RES domain-containing protein